MTCDVDFECQLAPCVWPHYGTQRMEAWDVLVSRVGQLGGVGEPLLDPTVWPHIQLDILRFHSIDYSRRNSIMETSSLNKWLIPDEIIGHPLLPKKFQWAPRVQARVIQVPIRKEVVKEDRFPFNWYNSLTIFAAFEVVRWGKTIRP